MERSIDDTYRRTLFIGFLNTVFVGLISIVLATILGCVIGTLRDSDIPGLKAISSVCVQIFWNKPLILQIVFLYSILNHFPGPKQAYALGDVIFMSNRRIEIPVLNLPLWSVGAIFCFGAGLAWVLLRSQLGVWQGVAIWIVGVSAAVVIAIASFVPEGSSVVSVPFLKGLRLREGVTLSAELVAMVIGTVLYSAAYIAEAVRGGLNEVPKGLVEAGKSPGLGVLRFGGRSIYPWRCVQLFRLWRTSVSLQ